MAQATPTISSRREVHLSPNARLLIADAVAREQRRRGDHQRTDQENSPFSPIASKATPSARGPRTPLGAHSCNGIPPFDACSLLTLSACFHNHLQLCLFLLSSVTRLVLTLFGALPAAFICRCTSHLNQHIGGSGPTDPTPPASNLKPATQWTYAWEQPHALILEHKVLRRETAQQRSEWKSAHDKMTSKLRSAECAGGPARCGQSSLMHSLAQPPVRASSLFHHRSPSLHSLSCYPTIAPLFLSSHSTHW